MNLLAKTQRGRLMAALSGFALVGFAWTARANGNLTLPIDPAFTNGLSAIKGATGFIERMQRDGQTRWQPNLQVLVGVKATEGPKQTVRFVELTTVTPPTTDSAGQPWTAPLRTNKWSWAATNNPAATNQSAEYVSPIYPVRVRVFDETGSVLKEGDTSLPWGLTNGLVDVCRISLALNAAWENVNGTLQTNSSLAVTKRLHLLKRRHRTPPTTQTAALKPSGRASETAATPPADWEDRESDESPPKYTENDDLMRSVGGGFLWMMTMFDQLRTVPAVRGIWEKVRYAVRLPNLKTMATSVLKGRFELSLHPRFAEVELVDSAAINGAEPWYHLPVDMNFGNQNLARLDMIVGPPDGAEVLLAGIKSIRATHPDRPQQELMAQLLATGRTTEKR